LSAAALSMIARAGILVLLPWPLKFILDNVILGRPLPHWAAELIPPVLAHGAPLLDTMSITLLVLGFADTTLDYLGNRLFLTVGQRIVLAIRCDMFAHLLALPPAFHRRRRAGELMSRLGQDIPRVQEFVSILGATLLPNALTLVGIIVVMAAVDFEYALFALVMAPLLILISRRWSGLLRTNLRRVRALDGELWAAAQEMLSAVQLVQASGRQRHEQDGFANKAGASLDASLHASRIQAQFTPLVNLVIATGGGIITWYGAVRVIEGSITAGDLLVFLAYLRGLVTPARQVAKAAPVLGRTAIALERIRDLFAERASVAERPGAIAPSHCAGWLEFRNVSFGYDAGASTLTDVSFRLERGRTIALVGPIGSGKSTIAALATRFIDPTAGEILLDGRPLPDLPLTYVRRNITLLSQEPLLLHGTVWENITYARPGADRDAAMRAAAEAGVDEIIAALSGGYDHPVVERGATLSGGQRQCIAIARATLADSPIVILDEPTSSLDATTERRIMAALERLTETRAAIIIAHRLDTIRSADQIIVLDRGRVVQSGTHRVLVGSPGLYATLCEAQGVSRFARAAQVVRLAPDR
jgi:ATP-binding cassette subfamily B protein/subfamily B ATP-binding cassette protein MsbA